MGPTRIYPTPHANSLRLLSHALGPLRARESCTRFCMRGMLSRRGTVQPMFRFCNKYSGEASAFFFSCSQGCLAGCVLVGRRRHHFHSLAHPGQDGTLGRDLTRQQEHPGFCDDISTNVSYYPPFYLRNFLQEERARSSQASHGLCQPWPLAVC